MEVPSARREALERTARAASGGSASQYFYYCCYYRGVPAFFRFQFIFSYLSPPVETMLRSSSRFIHYYYDYYYYYHRCIYAFFFAFTEGDKSTETSMCKCCDIKNDNGKRQLLLLLFTPTAKVCVFIRPKAGTLTHSHTTWV